jgi:hypothetical protein
MKTIRNRSARPLKIHLPGGKVLHLGPGNSGQVHDKALERPAFQKLLEAGDVEVTDEGGGSQGGGGDNKGSHEATHGHPPTTAVHPKGDR